MPTRFDLTESSLFEEINKFTLRPSSTLPSADVLADFADRFRAEAFSKKHKKTLISTS